MLASQSEYDDGLQKICICSEDYINIFLFPQNIKEKICSKMFTLTVKQAHMSLYDVG